jgi:hypothetical protein
MLQIGYITKKNPLPVYGKGIFLVAEADKISGIKLLNNIYKIIEFIELKVSQAAKYPWENNADGNPIYIRGPGLSPAVAPCP